MKPQYDNVDVRIFNRIMNKAEDKINESYSWAIKIHGREKADKLFTNLATALSAYRIIFNTKDN